MQLEFMSDRQTFILIVLALSSLAMLAAGFVYPRTSSRRLTALRVMILILFFMGAVSLTLVYPVSNSGMPAVYIIQDRSVSMNQAPVRGGQTYLSMADGIGARLSEACESAGISATPIFFAEEAGDRLDAVGDRRTTHFSPALSLLLERAASRPGGISPTRAILISDGAAADEPMMDPYLSALLSRGIPVDVWPLGTPADVSHPKVFFKLPPPDIATVGESVPLDIGLVSTGPTRVSISDGEHILLERRLSAEESLRTDIPEFILNPRTPGLRKVTVTAQNEFGSSKLHFRIKVLPRLTFELTGRMSWDARYFLVAASARSGISVLGRWTAGAGPDPKSATLTVAFGHPSRPVRSTDPVLYWAQSSSPPDDAGKGSERGIRWMGPESGSFLPAASDALPSRPVPPVAVRQKVFLDLGWKVIERYGDGGIFLAERVDSLSAPAFLVNGEGLWRWWAASRPIMADPKTSAGLAVDYERFLDRVISWARRTTLPSAELFALQEAGQIGMPMDLIALFSSPPHTVPVLKILDPAGGEQNIYGAGSASIRYSFIPKRPGEYRAALFGGSTRPVETTFGVSDAPFDISHPEPRPDLLRRIAARTGGRILPFTDLSAGADRPAGTASLDEGVARLMVSHVEAVHLATNPVEEKRIRLAQSPVFLFILTLLFAFLWTLESRWLR